MSSWDESVWFTIRVCELEAISPWSDKPNQFKLDMVRWRILQDAYEGLYGISIPDFRKIDRGVT